MNRRNFIQSTLASGSLLSLGVNPLLQNKLKPIIMATSWGYKASIDQFCSEIKKEGYDGLEIWWNDDLAFQETLMNSLEKHQLRIGFLTAGQSSDFASHETEFRKNLDKVLNSEFKPLYINCHSGKDFFEPEQNHKIIEYSIQASKQSGVPVMHETHRSRMCYSAPLTAAFLRKYPDMRLTLDISHWVNVHESLLENQPENVAIALERTRHVHLRVGHQEGPQVNDPRAPEWEKTLKAHLDWWDRVVEYRIKEGATTMTFLTEFGPPNYMQTLPYTRQAVSNQWEINAFMMQLIRQRYA